MNTINRALRNQYNFRNVLLASIVAIMTACGDSSGGDGDPIVEPQSGAQAECGGTRIWDFGQSDVITNANSYVSEAWRGENENSKFPCLAFWEYVPSVNCSLLYTYEEYSQEFELDPAVVSQISISGSNLIVSGSNGVEASGSPSTISIGELAELPDCALE